MGKKGISGILSEDKEIKDRAFLNAYELNKHIVYRIIFSYVPNKDFCEEMTYQIFSYAYINLHMLKSEFGFNKWIEQIARNTVKKELNNMNKQSKAELTYRDLEKLNSITLDFQDYSILDCLDEIEKQVILYSVVYEYSVREIAKILNIPKSNIHRIYQNSKEKLEKAHNIKSHL